VREIVGRIMPLRVLLAVALILCPPALYLLLPHELHPGARRANVAADITPQQEKDASQPPVAGERQAPSTPEAAVPASSGEAQPTLYADADITKLVGYRAEDIAPWRSGVLLTVVPPRQMRPLGEVFKELGLAPTRLKRVEHTGIMRPDPIPYVRWQASPSYEIWHKWGRAGRSSGSWIADALDPSNKWDTLEGLAYDVRVWDRTGGSEYFERDDAPVRYPSGFGHTKWNR
jgi:hypothetical protein